MAFKVRAVSSDTKSIPSEPFLSQSQSTQKKQAVESKKVTKIFVMNQKYDLGKEHLITGEKAEMSERLFFTERGLTPLYTWSCAEKGDLFFGPGPMLAERYTVDTDRILSEFDEERDIVFLDEPSRKTTSHTTDFNKEKQAIKDLVSELVKVRKGQVFELNFAEHGSSLDISEVEAVVKQLRGRVDIVRLVGCTTSEKAKKLSKVIGVPVVGTTSKISIVSKKNLRSGGKALEYTGFLTSAPKTGIQPYEVNFKNYHAPVKMYQMDASDVVMYVDGKEVSHSDEFFTQPA